MELECDFVAGCDGFHGVSRSSIPAGRVTLATHDYPFAWLGILADAPPSTEEVIYCHNARGFALHSMRSPTVSRLYLQCDPQDPISDWSDDRIWEELRLRFFTDDGWTLKDGPIIEKSITPMRSVVAEPMQYGRLFLAGDAAHIVPPTGAKGLNQAVADVAVLAEALTEWYRTQRRVLLDSYSRTCLRRVWRVQHFAAWMTWAFHTWERQGDFVHRMQAMQLENVCSSPAAARALAQNYAGLPIEANLPALGHRPTSRAAGRARGRRVVALTQPSDREPTYVGSMIDDERFDSVVTSG
jgi:p-hydroxybenzoate 3-monooxygenase